MTQPSFHLNECLAVLQQDWGSRFRGFQVTGRVCPYHLFADPAVFQASIAAILGYLATQSVDFVSIEMNYQDDRSALPEVMIMFVFTAKKENEFMLWNFRERAREAAFSAILKAFDEKGIRIDTLFIQEPEKLYVTFYCSHDAF
jgi:hypothetical protein